MTELQFEWDERKNEINQLKHGISFEMAQTAFFDEQGGIEYDPDHSKSEDRFLLMARDVSLRVLITSYCYRGGNKVRIISAAEQGEKSDSLTKGDPPYEKIL